MRAERIENSRTYIYENAVSAPRPDFPWGFRGDHITGSGVYVFHIDERGLVTSVTVAQSSGNGMLDVEAMRTFKRWRFKPGHPAVATSIPVTWHNSRVDYWHAPP